MRYLKTDSMGRHEILDGDESFSVGAENSPYPTDVVTKIIANDKIIAAHRDKGKRTVEDFRICAEMNRRNADLAAPYSVDDRVGFLETAERCDRIAQKMSSK